MHDRRLRDRRADGRGDKSPKGGCHIQTVGAGAGVHRHRAGIVVCVSSRYLVAGHYVSGLRSWSCSLVLPAVLRRSARFSGGMGQLLLPPGLREDDEHSIFPEGSVADLISLPALTRCFSVRLQRGGPRFSSLVPGIRSARRTSSLTLTNAILPVLGIAINVYISTRTFQHLRANDDKLQPDVDLQRRLRFAVPLTGGVSRSRTSASIVHRGRSWKWPSGGRFRCHAIAGLRPARRACSRVPRSWCSAGSPIWRRRSARSATAAVRRAALAGCDVSDEALRAAASWDRR